MPPGVAGGLRASLRLQPGEGSLLSWGALGWGRSRGGDGAAFVPRGGARPGAVGAGSERFGARELPAAPRVGSPSVAAPCVRSHPCPEAVGCGVTGAGGRTAPPHPEAVWFFGCSWDFSAGPSPVVVRGGCVSLCCGIGAGSVGLVERCDPKAAGGAGCWELGPVQRCLQGHGLPVLYSTEGARSVCAGSLDPIASSGVGWLQTNVLWELFHTFPCALLWTGGGTQRGDALTQSHCTQARPRWG